MLDVAPNKQSIKTEAKKDSTLCKVLVLYTPNLSLIVGTTYGFPHLISSDPLST